MAVEIKIPSVGESITEVTIAQWFKKDGEHVEKDEPLLEMETDKVNQELPAPESGTLRISSSEGETIAVGFVVGSIEPGGKPDKPSTSATPEAKSDEPPKVNGGVTKAQTLSSKATPVAKKIADEYGLDLEQVKGTGTGGKVTKDDILATVEKQNGNRPETPSAPAVEPPAKQASPAPAKPAAGSRGVHRERMSTLRRKIAVRLVEAQHTAAMLTTFNEVDMSAVMAIRTKYKERFKEKHGVGLGFMSFFVRAAVEALREFPRVNAYISGEEIEYHDYNDIGVAVGTEKGLVVPVLRNAESMSFSGVEKAIRDYALKARDGKLAIDDLTGGTFTISNGGVYGSMMSTPILNPPQSGILGMHNIIERPIAINGEVKIRPMMYLALSYDHRIVDGKEAVGFLVRIKECIESPERLLLEI